MNSKIDNGSDKNGKLVSLRSVLEIDINRLQIVSDETCFYAHKFIHTIRKSLKQISAILLLCKAHFNSEEYLSWRSYVKSLSRKYGEIREPFVFLQTLHRIEEKLKYFDSSNLFELRYNLELQYNLIDHDIKCRKETIQSGKDSIIKFTEEISNLDINFKRKPLKRALLFSFQKTRRLFIELSLRSSADKYHEFRKWCKIYYHQQLVLNRIGSEKMSPKCKRLYKLTEFLGKEHDLQMFYQYLSTYFP